MAANECLDLGRMTNHLGHQAILTTVLKTQIKKLVKYLPYQSPAAMEANECLDLGRITNQPGYRAILRTVLKTQIKQLVEQLSFYAGEEAILLSASITDGTLSHIGSKSGEIFLKTHGQVKSEFLGFCLNRHKKSRVHEGQTGQPSRPNKAKAQIVRKAVTSINPAKRKTVTECENYAYQEKLIDMAGNVLEDRAYGTSIEKCPNNTENLCENDADCNNDMEMVANANELTNMANNPDDVQVGKEDAGNLSTPVNTVDAEDTAENKKKTFEIMDMAFDSATGEMLGAASASPSQNLGETSLLGKEEAESDVSVGDTSEDVAGLSNDSTGDTSQASTVGVNRSGKLTWTAPHLLPRYTREKRGYGEKRRLSVHSIGKKFLAIMAVEAGKKKKNQIARDFNIPQNTLSTWIRSAEQIKDEYLRNDYGPERKRLRRSQHPDIDMVLLDWVRDAKIHQFQVSSSLLMEKANEVARNLGYPDELFTCTVSWVERFKARYGLTVKRK